MSKYRSTKKKRMERMHEDFRTRVVANAMHTGDHTLLEVPGFSAHSQARVGTPRRWRDRILGTPSLRRLVT